MEVERVDLSAWGDLLPGSGAEVFHTPEALGVLDDHVEGDLRLYAGFKGDQPVALLPLVHTSRMVGRAFLSPPPSAGVPHMGPIVASNSPKRGKRERVNRRFTGALLEELPVDESNTLLRFVCSPDYADPRPYQWNDMNVEPRFTYRLTVGDDADGALAGFSSSLRREVSSLPDLGLDIDTEGTEAAKRIYDDLAERYAEEGDTFALDWPYVRDVVTELGDRSRVYVARDGAGDFLGGIVVLYSDDAAYFWEGGSRADHESVSVNSLLHWRIIEDVAEDPALESVHTYDLVGANTERLCRYKAKFNPDLLPYYVVESGGTGMDVAKRAYRLVRR